MFNVFGLNPIIMKNVKARGYVEPTPVQSAVIRPALDGRDLVVTAETGSGKTAAFALPLIEHLMGKKERSMEKKPQALPAALVLCPTREVAQQLNGEIAWFARGTGISTAAVYGGVGMQPQVNALKSGTTIIVATPGRLLDHLQRGNVDLGGIKVLILDEADRMLDMGFLPDVSRIISRTPRERQTMLFSATMPHEVLGLVNRFLRNPATLAEEENTTPPETLAQAVCPAVQEEKTKLLVSLLRERNSSRVLVFARTKYRAERVARQLAREGFRAACIHGGRSQQQRDAALDGFRRGQYKVLVGTDVAARGIDVFGVTHVVNYDFPSEPNEYIHRVGRTARAGRDGSAVSFVTMEDRKVLQDIEHVLGQRIPLWETQNS
ncbi:MAG: DEAD/DEAH box helicase [Bacillota bacterium]|nr:DEAD/DEAH box helicase [Bacillota bacterium]